MMYQWPSMKLLQTPRNFRILRGPFVMELDERGSKVRRGDLGEKQSKLGQCEEESRGFYEEVDEAI